MKIEISSKFVSRDSASNNYHRKIIWTAFKPIITCTIPWKIMILKDSKEQNRAKRPRQPFFFFSKVPKNPSNQVMRQVCQLSCQYFMHTTWSTIIFCFNKFLLQSTKLLRTISAHTWNTKPSCFCFIKCQISWCNITISSQECHKTPQIWSTLI